MAVARSRFAANDKDQSSSRAMRSMALLRAAESASRGLKTNWGFVSSINHKVQATERDT
jgi:hypothetical protein